MVCKTCGKELGWGKYYGPILSFDNYCKRCWFLKLRADIDKELKKLEEKEDARRKL